MKKPRATQLIEQYGGQVTLIPDKFSTHAMLGHGVRKNKLTILDRLTAMSKLVGPVLLSRKAANGRIKSLSLVKK